MKLTFLETPVFTDQITRLLDDADYRCLQEHLLRAPTAGDLIIGTGGCRKIRWAATGRSACKRGGIRVIYFYRTKANQVLFLLAYDHRAIDDLTPGQKKQLATLVKQLK
ncbi:MAG: hypothetical protein WBN34_10780 [Woeseia sp.]